YTGTVHFTSTDPAATLPPDTVLTSGVGTLSATLKSSGSQTLTATDSAVSTITGTSNPIAPAATQFVINALSSTTAGDAFVFMVTAQNQFGTATGYAGTVHFSSSDSQVNLPADVTLNSGQGFFAAILKTAGNQTLSAVDKINSALTGSTAAIVVQAGAIHHFAVAVPATAATEIPFSFSATALDAFGNLAPNYAGTVHFTSSDGAAALPADSMLTSGIGTFSATLKTAGNQLLFASDTVASGVISNSSFITTRNLVVTSSTPTPTGFVASFNKAFDASVLNLYDSVNTHGAADVTVVGPSGLVRGSLLLDTANNAITFVKTGVGATGLFAGILTPGNYTVTFRSASNAFKDLDGNNDNVAGDNYQTTFAVTAANNPVLSIPDFARGPNAAADIKIPNGTGTGLPITLSNAANVTDVTFALHYNPALLNVTGALGNTSGAFTLVGTPTAGLANFSYHANAPINGNKVLGQIVAQVPDSAAGQYKAKELLHLSDIVLDGSAAGVANDDGVHVVAYVGDATGDGSLSPLDAALVSRVATTLDSGFAGYRLVDPGIVADINGNGFADSGDVTLANRFVAGVVVPQLPTTPPGLTITPTGPDPTLSLPENLVATPGQTVVVPVSLDNARPEGSTGLMEAVLALRYDPAVFTVSAADVHLGTLPASGSGWKLQAVVNAQTGEIGIDLFSTT
ncbi:MAG TPA: hypothetical protein VE988_05685, partial [Gemmataceae bacterium]|nr:hypothetical protein [Gemmataceae bacterium]